MTAELTQRERIRALADPRSGAYHNKETMRYECFAVVNGNPIMIGWVDDRTPEEGRRVMISRIWAAFIDPKC